MEEKPPNKQDHEDRDTWLSRITLRPLDLSDVDDFMVWATDERVTRFCTWDTYTNKEEAIKFIKNSVLSHPWYRAICLDDKPIGSITVDASCGNNDKCRGMIGYVLGYKYWGKGIATQAVKLVVETIFKDWPHLVRLEGLVFVQNLGSQKVLEKNGFVREGVLRKYMLIKGEFRDLVMFSRLSSD